MKSPSPKNNSGELDVIGFVRRALKDEPFSQLERGVLSLQLAVRAALGDISSFLWGAWLFDRSLIEEAYSVIGIETSPHPEVGAFLVPSPNGVESLMTYDLLLLDARVEPNVAFSGVFEYDFKRLEFGLQDYLSALVSEGGLQRNKADEIHYSLSKHPQTRYQFRIVVARTPSVIMTMHPVDGIWTVPDGPNKVFPDADPDNFGSVGIVIESNNGNFVTTALHVVEKFRDQALSVGRIPAVFVGGHEASDTALLRLDMGSEIQLPRTVARPMCGIAPRPYEKVRFLGAKTSVWKETTVSAISPELPIEIDRLPPRLLTPPVTIPGDSGAALINAKGEVLGFASFRTGFGEVPAFSAWIWACTAVRNVTGNIR